MPTIQQLSTQAAIASLQSTPEGLTSVEAQRRLAEHGSNVVQELARESPWLRFFKEFAQFFSLILWFAAGLAFLGELIDPGQGMAKIGFAIVAVILVSGLFSFWQEYRVERTLAALRKLLPQRVQALRDRTVMQIDAEALVPGDIVLLGQGDNIPADCRLLEAFGIRVNSAALTGEAAPQTRDAQPFETADLLSCRNIVPAGASLVSGQAKALVFATGMHTEFGKIAHLTQTAGEVASPLKRQLAHLSRLIAVLAVVIGLIFFAIGQIIGVSFWQDFMFAIGIIVAMVPEGLLPTLTLALVLTTQRLAKRNVLVRYLPSVEALGATTVICTDKTGTLTQNRMAVKCILLGDRLVASCAPPTANVVEAYRPAFLTARLCHDLKQTDEDGQSRLRGDPMEIALVEMAQQALPELPPYRRVNEIPFDADRMRLSTIHAMPEGATLYCKGALESVLPLCSAILTDGQTCALGLDLREQIVGAEEAIAEQGLRVLALAYRALPPECKSEDLERDLVFAGLVGLEDPPRPEVADAIHRCREAGVKVIMVTGDHPRTAAAVARNIGLVQAEHPSIITGEALRHLSMAQLILALDASEIIFARVTADQKTRVVEALKDKKHIVAVTGDGVNDAPALKSAHTGIAMGITGTDVAKEAADIVLLDDNFASIVYAIEEGRAVFENIRRFLTYVLVHNVAELMPYLGFVLFKIPLALTPIQALAIDMGTDTLTALGLGVERPSPRAMHRPPRNQDERLLNRSLALRAYLFLGLIEAAAAMAAFFVVLHAGGWQYGLQLSPHDPLYLQATTACLCTIIVLQMVNAFMCRSASRSILSVGMLGNRLLIAGVVLDIVSILVINCTPWGNLILGTAPVAAAVWMLILAFAGTMVVLEELRKSIVRKMRIRNAAE
jgi:calcium-translocating P-type ATPase